MMRIWYQGLIPRTRETLPYYTAMEEHAREVAGPSVDFEFHGLPPDAYPTGMGPPELTGYIAGEYLEIGLFARMIGEAEEAGCDAVIIGTLQEPGLPMLRTLSDMPIVGFGEAASLIGRHFGDRVGILAFNEVLFPVFKRRLNRHVPESVGPIARLDVTYEELHACFAGAPPEHLRTAISAGCDDLVAMGASLIVPGQMLLTEAVRILGITRVDEVPVLDGLAALVLLAKSLVVLRGCGMTISRRGFAGKKAAPAVLQALTTGATSSASGKEARL